MFTLESRKFLIKVNTPISYDPEIPFLPKSENLSSHKNLYVEVFSSLTHNHKTLERTKMFSNQWTDKQTLVYPHSRILFSNKTSKITPNLLIHTTTWLNLKCFLLTKKKKNQIKRLQTKWFYCYDILEKAKL